MSALTLSANSIAVSPSYKRRDTISVKVRVVMGDGGGSDGDDGGSGDSDGDDSDGVKHQLCTCMVVGSR